MFDIFNKSGMAYELVSAHKVGGVASLHAGSNEGGVASVPGCFTKGIY